MFDFFLVLAGVFVFFLGGGEELSVFLGGREELIPPFEMATTVEKHESGRVQTPLELAGFNVYLREGCYNCHSQRIRSSRPTDEMGPDLRQLGGKYPDDALAQRLTDPTLTRPEAHQPQYPHLSRALDYKTIAKDMSALRAADVAYTDEQIVHAGEDLEAQASTAKPDVSTLRRYPWLTPRGRKAGEAGNITEVDALVAYLQILGVQGEAAELDLWK